MPRLLPDEEHEDPLAMHDNPCRPPTATDMERYPWLRHIDAQQRQLDAVLVHQRTVAQQIADLAIRQQRADAHQVTTDRRLEHVDEKLATMGEKLDRHIADNGRRFDGLESGQEIMLKALAENTSITVQVKDVMTSARLASKFAKWAGPIVVLVSSLVGLWIVVNSGVGPA